MTCMFNVRCALRTAVMDHIATVGRPWNKRLTMILFIILLFKATSAEIPDKDLQFLNELPLEKLLKLKDSLQDFVTENVENITVTTPTYLQAFGAQALAMKAPPIKRTDYEEHLVKKESKISNIFSMSVTTLAFLAFGGYLLCLIVQAVKAKEQYAAAAGSQTTLVVNAGIKKRPLQTQAAQTFASYGRRKRDNREQRALENLDLSPEQLFSALLQVCEGYAKWSENVDQS